MAEKILAAISEGAVAGQDMEKLKKYLTEKKKLDAGDKLVAEKLGVDKQNSGERFKGGSNPVEIKLEYKAGMQLNEFKRKADALKELGDKGLLYKAENPVKRDPSITRKYRQDMIKRIWNQYGLDNPQFANKLIDRVTTKMQPDHVWELQLGGPDTMSNIRFLDTYTNWHIGTQQIRPQIKDLPIGTKIVIKIEGI